MESRGLKRLLIFIVFLIPVTWYLILQLFGENRFALTQIGTIPSACIEDQGEVMIVAIEDSLSLAEKNYMSRVSYAAEKRKITVSHKPQRFFDCINHSDADLVILEGKNLWGTYQLNRKGVDQLLTELDVLLLQKSYGKGTSR